MGHGLRSRSQKDRDMSSAPRFHDSFQPSLECPDHVPAHEAGAYASGDAQTIARWGDHIHACACCRSLVEILRTPSLPEPPLTFEEGHFAWGNTIQLLWGLGANQRVRLSLENRHDPSISQLVDRVTDLFDRRWTEQGFACECSIDERIARDDIVLVAVDSEGDHDPTPHGAIFGRLSRQERPTFDELGCDGAKTPSSLNFYAVVVDGPFRGRSVAMKLLLAAARHFTERWPELIVQTMSPLAGFRPYVARLVGASKEAREGATKASRGIARSLDSLTEPASLREILQREDALCLRFRSRLGMTPHRWLVRACNDPAAMLDDWNAARDDPDARESMRSIVCLLAERYATGTWTLEPTRSRASIACYVSHFHQRNGAHFAGIRAFSRPDDPENLFCTAAFRYPTLDPSAARDNHRRFVAQQDAATKMAEAG